VVDGRVSNPQTGGAADKPSFLGGGQVGYDWQIDSRWVVGIEGDWDYLNSRYGFCRQTSTPSTGGCSDNGFGFETISSNTEWLSTARGRLGVIATNNMLVYVTGGAAWGRVSTTLGQSCLVGGCGQSILLLATSSTSTTTKTGWVAGLGGEMQFTGNWFARVEWLHINLGTISNALTTVGVVGTQTTIWSRTEQYDEIRLGLDYRFLGG
jgi:outer membrane immunogenic protein